MKRKVISILLVLALCLSMGVYPTQVKAATGTAITSAEDFMAMESNPDGTYYLANDITLPANTTVFSQNTPFTGVFNGNGHGIKNYTYTLDTDNWQSIGLFQQAKDATFKDLTLSNVNVSITTKGDLSYGTLVNYATNCKFQNITTTGKVQIAVSGEGGYTAAGQVAVGGATFINCVNKINFTATASGEQFMGGQIGGIAGVASSGNFTKCTNSGKITITAAKAAFSTEMLKVAGIAPTGDVNCTNCKNTGALTITVKGGTGGNSLGDQLLAAGIAGRALKAVSCSNTGKITVTCPTSRTGECKIAGLFGFAKTLSKSKNTGAISFTGKSSTTEENYVAGLLGSGSVTQSFNKGKVTAKVTGAMNVGGIGGMVYQMNNCYNVGTVTLSKGSGNVGGLAGYGYTTSDTIACNYSKAKITGTKGAKKGALLGYYSGTSKRLIDRNYYTGSMKPYGASDITWKEWVAKATKVSSLSKGNCPKLSSTYWTYSSKYKRMILKNNKE